MKFEEQEFIPLIFAGDINSYSMARAFYEEYKVKSVVYGKYNTGPNCNSKIIDYRVNPNIEKESVFLKIVNKIAEEDKDKKVVLVGCADSYVALASKLKKDFSDNVIAAYIDYALMKRLILKEEFYQICDEYQISYPKTYIYNRRLGHKFTHHLQYPLILKPSYGVQYWENKFEGQKKVYKVKTEKELIKTIDEIYDAGYQDSLVLQDMVPGDDTDMYVLTGYCDRNSKVKLMALGNVLMEEHTPKGLGNHSVIINDYNKEIVNNVKNFLEDIGYIGFFNLDIKYDCRDNTYKFFEINTRQGRSNYYVTGAGYNLSKYLVDEYIHGKEHKYTIAKNKKLWLVIPVVLALIFTKSKKYRKEIFRLVINGRVVNPIFYIKDMRFIRSLRFLKSHLSHFRKMGLE